VYFNLDNDSSGECEEQDGTKSHKINGRPIVERKELWEKGGEGGKIRMKNRGNDN